MENLINYIIILVALMFLVIKLLPQKNKNLPPSPLGLPIIGHLHLIRQPLHQSLQNLISRHGPILFLRLGGRRLLLLSCPSAVEDCFTTNDIVFANRPRTLAADHVTYNYKVFVVTPYGDLWRSLRRVLVVEVLSSVSLQKSAAVREAEARNILRRLFKASPEKAGEVDLKVLFNLFTVNVIFSLLTGNRGIEEDDEETEAAELSEFKKLFSPSLNLDLWDFFPVLRRIGFARRREEELRDLQKRRDDYMNDLIGRARAERETGDGVRSSEKEGSLPLIHRLLVLQDQDREFYTDDVAIKNMILTLLIAATETTAITLEWAMSLLLAHPKELKKTREEMETVIGNTTTSRRLLQDSDLVKLHHLRCVVKETLRLCPPAPFLLPHCASEDCTVGGYNVPRDTILMVNTLALHKDPTVWDEPDRFIPDRFRLEEAEEEGVKYVPFGTGRRACPGVAMALRVVMLALGLMVQCFEWESIDGSQIEDVGKVQGVTLSKVKPLKARCMPRQEFVKLLSQL